MFPESIRWRLQLWLGFLLICILTGFGAAIYQLQWINQLNRIDEDLGRRVAALNSALRVPPAGEPRGFGGRPGGHEPMGPPNGPGGPGRGFEPARPPDDWRRNEPEPPFRSGPPPGMGRGPREMFPREFRPSPQMSVLFDESETNGFYYVVWARNGNSLKASSNSPPNIPFPARISQDTRTHARMLGERREVFQFTELGDCLLAGRSLATDLSGQRRFALLLLAAGGAVLAFGLGVGWWLTTRAIRPIEEISVAASRISAGNLAERIRTPARRNELGRLAGVLNSTFARLEAAFSRQKQFTADASHELRTPLAVIISESQATLARERTAAEYRSTVEVCLETAQEMKRLTESLLDLARSDAGYEDVPHARFDLAALIRDCVERVRTLAEKEGLQIECKPGPHTAFGSADRIGQVITNLLTNAIYYNKPGGKIRITSREEPDRIAIIVSDTGQGIDSESLPHLFERFYRADQARSRAEGRSGLGLAISRAIVEAHGGSISVESRIGEGSTFTVRLPWLGRD